MSTTTNKEAAAPSRLGVWLHHHGHSVVFSLGRAWRKPWATLLTVMVMALALALPLGLSIALDNLKHFAGSVQQSRDINLFLKTDVDTAAAKQVADTLRGRADVAGVTLRSPDEGLAELRDSAGLGAGALALALVGGAGLALRPPLAALSQSYASPFVLHGLDLLHSSLVLVGTVVLGWLGAWLVTGHFLRQTRPTET